MNTRISTILVVRTDNKDTVSFNLNTKHIERWKIYLAGFISFFTVLVFIIAGLSFTIISKNSEKENLLGQIRTMENDVKLVDSLQIKQRIENIDKRLLDIDNYMKERGLVKKSGIGGEPDFTRNTNPALYILYDTYVELLLKTIKNVPMGYPHIGEIKSEYGYRSNPFWGRSSEFHKGIDIKGNIGDPVKCTANGVVVSADWDKGYGKCIKIAHGNGLETIFGHLSQFNVVQGERVKAGDIIGYVGNTGRSTGSHLHYEIRQDETDINPQPFLNIKN